MSVKSGGYSHRGGGKKKDVPAKVRSVEISGADNGGVSVTHHYDNSGDGGYTPSKVAAAFGPEDGEQVMSHLSEHLPIKMGKKNKKEKETDVSED